MQNINVAGLFITPTLLWKPSNMVPHFQYENISAIDPWALKEAGIEGVIFDKDETLTEKYHSLIHPKIANAFDEYKNCFANNLLVLSNQLGTRDVRIDGEVKRFEKDSGITVIRHSWKKPGQIDLSSYVANHHKWAMIGDSALTDVLGGNRMGMITFLTKKLSESKDTSLIGRTREFERYALDYLIKKGVQAPKHALYEKVRSALNYSR